MGFLQTEITFHVHKNLTKIYIVFLNFISDNIGAGSNTLFTHVIELTFKRTVSSPTMRKPPTPLGGFYFIFFYRSTMDIYIYSDESGVFDKQHNDF